MHCSDLVDITDSRCPLVSALRHLEYLGHVCDAEWEGMRYVLWTVPLFGADHWDAGSAM